jgi:hypothetical protein
MQQACTNIVKFFRNTRKISYRSHDGELEMVDNGVTELNAYSETMKGIQGPLCLIEEPGASSCTVIPSHGVTLVH